MIPTHNYCVFIYWSRTCLNPPGGVNTAYTSVGSEPLLAQRVVVLDSLDFVLKLLDPAQDVHVLLL